MLLACKVDCVRGCSHLARGRVFDHDRSLSPREIGHLLDARRSAAPAGRDQGPYQRRTATKRAPAAGSWPAAISSSSSSRSAGVDVPAVEVGAGDGLAESNHGRELLADVGRGSAGARASRRRGRPGSLGVAAVPSHQADGALVEAVDVELVDHQPRAVAQHLREPAQRPAERDDVVQRDHRDRGVEGARRRLEVQRARPAGRRRRPSGRSRSRRSRRRVSTAASSPSPAPISSTRAGGGGSAART